jgi:hypothetical protein
MYSALGAISPVVRACVGKWRSLLTFESAFRVYGLSGWKMLRTYTYDLGDFGRVRFVQRFVRSRQFPANLFVCFSTTNF